MTEMIRKRATVEPGGRIEITLPELETGTEVEISIQPQIKKTEAGKSLMDFWGSARGLFNSGEEVDEFVRGDRDAWEE